VLKAILEDVMISQSALEDKCVAESNRGEKLNLFAQRLLTATNASKPGVRHQKANLAIALRRENIFVCKTCLPVPRIPFTTEAEQD
jgi:hypothetical protein